MALTKEQAALAGIYAITHLPSGRVYVGSTTNFGIRWKGHRHLLRKNRHSNAHLQNAWNSDGEPAFEFGVLEVVRDTTGLLALEGEWFSRTNCCDRSAGFNIVRDPTLRRWTDEQRERLSKSTKGRPGRPHSSETRAVMSAQRQGKRPYIMGEETKRKLSVARTGSRLSEESKAKVSRAKRALSDTDVATAKSLLAAGRMVNEVAEALGVHRKTISKVKLGRYGGQYGSV